MFSMIGKRGCFIAIVALLILGFLGSSTARSQPLKKITVVYTVISGDSIALWVAYEKGYFRRHGMDVQLEFITGSNQTAAAMVAGKVDFTNAGGGAVVESDLAGGDITIIGSTVPYFLNSLFSQPEIHSVQELKGKRIAVTTLGTATDFARRMVMQKAGLNPDRDATVLQTKGVSEILQALLSKNVEAGMVLPPLTLIARQKGLRELVDLTAARIPYIQTSVATTRRLIQRDPELVENFMKAIVEANAFEKQDPKGTKEILSRYLKNMTEELLDETYNQFVTAIWRKYPDAPVDAIRTLLNFIALNNEKAKTAKPEQFMDMSFLRKLEASNFADPFLK
jgi:ABC-type nitrate/sulfonate/bicarbonate transport system substrate-binding protein